MYVFDILRVHLLAIFEPQRSGEGGGGVTRT